MNYDEMVKEAYEDILDSFEKQAGDLWSDFDEIRRMHEAKFNDESQKMRQQAAQELDKHRRLAQRAALGAGTVGLGLAGLGTYGVIKARQMYREKKKRDEQRDKNQSEIKEALKSYLANRS